MGRLREAIVICGWIGLLLITCLGITDAALAPTPASKQPDFIDTILASRAVVVALRIAIVFAAVFVALSVIALIARRQWLTRVGPVEVSDWASELKVESRWLKEHADTTDQAIEDLRESAAYSQRLLDRDQDR